MSTSGDGAATRYEYIFSWHGADLTPVTAHATEADMP
jgi:hypothetical protein